MTVEHLERILALTWPGLERDQVGDWLLRAGRGVTSRANSALVLGDPGRPHEDALDAVVSWYRARGLCPRLQIADCAHREVDAACARRGWAASSSAWVMTRSAVLDASAGAPLLGRQRPAALPDVEVEWSDAPPSTTDRDRAAEQTATPALYATLCVGGAAVGWGRLAVVEGYGVVTDLEVEPDRRNQGVGADLLEALCCKASESGATQVALQVLVNNPAHRLYRRLGFSEHHAYHYRTG